MSKKTVDREKIAHAPAPGEESPERAVMVVLVDGSRGGTTATPSPGSHLGEEGVDVRYVMVLDSVREAEPPPDEPEGGERVAVALDSAHGLAFGLDCVQVGGDEVVDLGHAAPSLSFSVDGHDSLCAATKASG